MSEQKAMTGTECEHKLIGMGASLDEVKKLKELEAKGVSVNWQNLWQWVQTDGVRVIAFLISVFANPTPAPTPGPTPAQS